MNTAIQDAQLTALLGRKWTDAKGKVWEVKRFANEPGLLRAIMAGSGRGKDMTPEEILAEIANDEGDGATNTVSLGNSAHSELIGRSWSDETGETLTVDRINGSGQVIAKDKDGFEQVYGLDEVIAFFKEETEAVDTTLADAGAVEDEQHRMRSLNPDSVRPRALTVPEFVLKSLNDKVRELQGLVTKDQGKGAVTLKVVLKPGDEPRELDVKYELGLTPPKLKSDDTFFTGTEIIPGLPKRDSDDQLTIVDAGATVGDDQADEQDE